MEKIVVLFTGSSFGARNDDDVIDRLNYRVTVAMLIVASLIVTVSTWIGTPITCWAPVHFTGSHTKYTNSYCWVKNTYYLPWNERVPHPDEPRQMITYYQWIPFILLAQAVFFYAPTLLWHMFNSKSGVDCDNILATAHTFHSWDKQEGRDKTLTQMVNQMDRFLNARPDDGNPGCHCDVSHLLSGTCCRPCGRRFGNYLVILYSITKLCFLANVILQFVTLDTVLGYRFTSSGFDIMTGDMLAADHAWEDQVYVAFPRVTFCDFLVRRLGNVHRYTVQCTLPLNLYNEKIYIGLWFWMIFVFIATLINLIIWSIRFIARPDRRKFLRNHLPDRIHTRSDFDLLNRFMNDYLKQDGAFVLRLIAHNTNTITTTEITCALFDSWKDRIETTDMEKDSLGSMPSIQENNVPMSPLEPNNVPMSPDPTALAVNEASTLEKKPLYDYDNSPPYAPPESSLEHIDHIDTEV